MPRYCLAVLGWFLAGIPPVMIGYGVLEARLFRLRRLRLPVLPAGSHPMTILQVSDLHFRPTTRRLASFIRSLAVEEYDIVLATGDLLGDPRAVDECATLLSGLEARVGRFYVFGSSDYYAPTFKNYFDYFTGRRKLGTKRNRTAEFRKALDQSGWIELTNTTLQLDICGLRSQITGLDDPYLRREDRSLLHRDEHAEFALCVVHDPSPYSAAAAAGFDLIVAGHTHGGQVRFPFLGAVVTNSDIPRNLARGLHQINGSWLHVSPGLGTGRYAPFRFMCRPEATVLDLVER